MKNYQDLISVLSDTSVDENFVIDYMTFKYNSCYPESVNEMGNTPLMLACYRKMSNVAILIIEIFEEKCKPDTINKDRYTALMIACYQKMNRVAIKLIDTFGMKCIPDCQDLKGNTALIMACLKKQKDVSLKIIKTYGTHCMPEAVNEFELTAFIIASQNNMTTICKNLTDIGYHSKIEEIEDDGQTSLISSFDPKNEKTSFKLKRIFRLC